MALQASQIIDEAQGLASFWSATWCPHRVLRQMVTDAQERIYAAVLRFDPYYLKQRFHLYVSIAGNNAVGVAGPTVGAFGMDGSAVDLAGATGQAQGVDLATATRLVGPAVVASATASTVTLGGVAWTTNQWQGKLVAVLAGPGAIQYRRIASNTSDTLTLTTNLTGSLTTTTLVAIYDAPDTVLDTTGVLLQYPPKREAVGFATKLDATGAAYLDLTTPLVGTYRSAVNLPDHQRLLDASAWSTVTTEDPWPIPILVGGQRDISYDGAALVRQGTTLTPIGHAGTWAQIRSVEVGFIPVPPAITDSDDYLLLGAAWRRAIVSDVARQIAERGLQVNACSELVYRLRVDDADRTRQQALDQASHVGQATIRYEVQAR